MKYKITFNNYRELPRFGDYDKYCFYYKIVNEKYIDKPEEESETKDYRITVKISHLLMANWDLKENSNNLIKVFFEFGKRFVIEKLKDKTLTDSEELFLVTYEQPSKCPYNPKRIKNPIDYSEIIEIPEKSLQENINFNKLATEIIEKRDKINARFYDKYKCKLFLLKSERDSSQLFKEANSEEELAHRVCSLANLVTNLNGNILKEILGSSSKDNKTIDLFEEYLKSFTKNSECIIKTFRNINKIRQSFPIHGDENSGLIEALKYFDIKYPIDNYNEAWKKLLNNYLISLEKILDIFTQEKETGI